MSRLVYEGDWFDDPRMGVDRGKNACGDDRLTWDQALFASHGCAFWEVHLDGEPTGIEVVGQSATDARKTLREQWVRQGQVWPGHKHLTLKYLMVNG